MHEMNEQPRYRIKAQLQCMIIIPSNMFICVFVLSINCENEILIGASLQKSSYSGQNHAMIHVMKT